MCSRPRECPSYRVMSLHRSLPRNFRSVQRSSKGSAAAAAAAAGRTHAHNNNTIVENPFPLQSVRVSAIADRTRKPLTRGPLRISRTGTNRIPVRDAPSPGVNRMAEGGRRQRGGSPRHRVAGATGILLLLLLLINRK